MRFWKQYLEKLNSFLSERKDDVMAQTHFLVHQLVSHNLRVAVSLKIAAVCFDVHLHMGGQANPRALSVNGSQTETAFIVMIHFIFLTHLFRG